MSNLETIDTFCVGKHNAIKFALKHYESVDSFGEPWSEFWVETSYVTPEEDCIGRCWSVDVGFTLRQEVTNLQREIVKLHKTRLYGIYTKMYVGHTKNAYIQISRSSVTLKFKSKVPTEVRVRLYKGELKHLYTKLQEWNTLTSILI